MTRLLAVSLIFGFLVLVQSMDFQNYKLSEIPLPPSSAPEPSVYPSETSKQNLLRVRYYNVKSFGAIGDGVSDDTQAFKMAWDAACQARVPSSLIVPRGKSFMILSTIFTGPCRNSITFQIDGTVTPPDGPKLWPMSSKRQCLVFYRINGMTMQGGGIIDGKGQKWWNLPCKPHKGTNGSTVAGPCDSPVMIRFFMSSNVTVQGFKVKNSPQFHFRFDGCQRVHIDSLNIRSPRSSPNTDGVHIENTNDVKIHNSIISNGDDCVSIGAGCHNVDIRNLTCGPSHGISIGSLGLGNSRACVSNITVSNSLIKNSDNGLRIKTWQGGSGSVSRVTYTNIRMDTVKNPIIIDQYYCLTKNCPNKTSAISITNISYINIKGTYDTKTPSIRLVIRASMREIMLCSNLKGLFRLTGTFGTIL